MICEEIYDHDILSSFSSAFAEEFAKAWAEAKRIEPCSMTANESILREKLIENRSRLAKLIVAAPGFQARRKDSENSSSASTSRWRTAQQTDNCWRFQERRSSACHLRSTCKAFQLNNSSIPAISLFLPDFSLCTSHCSKSEACSEHLPTMCGLAGDHV